MSELPEATLRAVLNRFAVCHVRTNAWTGALESKWAVYSRDAEGNHGPMPKDFVATFDNQEDAIECAVLRTIDLINELVAAHVYALNIKPLPALPQEPFETPSWPDQIGAPGPFGPRPASPIPWAVPLTPFDPLKETRIGDFPPFDGQIICSASLSGDVTLGGTQT